MWMVCDGGCLLALPLLSTKAEGNALVTRWSLLSSGCPWCAGWLLATGAGLGAPHGEARGSGQEGAAGGCGRNLLETELALGRAVSASGYSFVL